MATDNKLKYFCLAILLAVIGSFLIRTNCSAITITKDQAKLVHHWKVDGSSHGVGTDKLYDDDEGEAQGMAITPSHIVVSFLIDEGTSKPWTRSRIYFIDRKTLKIVKVIPDKENFNCDSYGNPGCYDHGNGFAYNWKNKQLILTTNNGSFLFDDEKMEYKQRLGYGCAKLGYNQKHDFFFSGNSCNDIRDSNLNFVRDVHTHLGSGVWYEEGASTWGDYLVTNSAFKGSDPPLLRFYDYKTSEHKKDVTLPFNNNLAEAVQFLADGTMLVMVPLNNSATGWGHGFGIYAISGKDLGISDSTNTSVAEGAEEGTWSEQMEASFKLNKAREGKCASLLPESYCKSAKDGDNGIVKILDMIISILSVGVSVMGTAGLIICALIITTSRDDPSRLALAKARLMQVSVGLLLYSIMYSIIGFLMPFA